MISDYVDERIKFYRERKKLVDSKNYNYIPFDKFPRFKNSIPGIVPGIMYKITSHTGVGKTQLSKYMFVYSPLLYAFEHNIDFHIIYIALEESKEEFLDNLFRYIVKVKTNIDINYFSMIGASGDSLTDIQLNAIDQCKPIINHLGQRIHVIDNLYRPSEIFQALKQKANTWGKFIDNNNDNYIPDNPKQIRLVVCDHVSLLESEFDTLTQQPLSLHQTIQKWSTNIAKRYITKKWNWAVLNVHQQALESERPIWSSSGQSIVEKLYPSIQGLGDNKVIARDDYVILGLFSPARYEIDRFKGYDITVLKDSFRSVHILKNRFGGSNQILPLYFNGAYGIFKEMPLSTSPEYPEFLKLIKQ